MKKYFIVSSLVGFMITTSNAFAVLPAAAPALPAGSKVAFTEPKDGATVPAKFTAKFSLAGLKIEKAGPLKPGTGHHHLIVDGTATPAGEVVAKDATHLHFGNGQTEAELTLTPGKHTLTLQFADGAHASYGPAMSQTITVNVKQKTKVQCQALESLTPKLK